jgi:glutamate N-acetyltransferase/amino-acid N-acetyltransferase
MDLSKLEVNAVKGGVCAPLGFKAAGIHAGIRKAMGGTGRPEKNDLGMIFAEEDCWAAAVYTQNKVKGAPLYVTQKHLANKKCRAVIVNSINANTCNADGIEKANMMCEITAKALNIDVEDVIPASTGVIGQILPIEPFEDAVPRLVKILSKTGNTGAAQAIMTTDTMMKELAVEFEIGGKKCRIGAMNKGSGMIHPNMATTLTFITTDVDINPDYLQLILRECVNITLNRVSVDGDTSTNDMALIMSSGLAGNTQITPENQADTEIFFSALQIVLDYLARKMARDGEGATKLIICDCINAASQEDADSICNAVITSNLFKAAMFGSDANWGRILCAVGNSGAEYFDPQQVEVAIASQKGELTLYQNGGGVEFSEEKATEILKEEEIIVTVNLNHGSSSSYAYGCDLTYNYVKINGDYRS